MSPRITKFLNNINRVDVQVKHVSGKLGHNYIPDYLSRQETPACTADKCQICNYSCSQMSNLTRHEESVHMGKQPVKGPPVKCVICHYSFTQSHALKKHIKSLHEGKKLHKCELCSKG